jgi:hypothetical protein
MAGKKVRLAPREDESPLANQGTRTGTQRGQKRKVTDDSDSGDFNIRSQERTELLTKLKAQLNQPVSPAFWACAQLADISSLKVLAESDPRMVLRLFHLSKDTLEYVPRLCELLDVLGHIEVVFYDRHAHG